MRRKKNSIWYWPRKNKLFIFKNKFTLISQDKVYDIYVWDYDGKSSISDEIVKEFIYIGD